MPCAGPKSKKSQPVPKSKKVSEKEPEVNNEEERDKQEGDVEEDEKIVETKNGNSRAGDSDEEDVEPPAKKVRGGGFILGKPAKKTHGNKGRASSRGRKTSTANNDESGNKDKESRRVQLIINDRIKKGSKEYLVKWEGYKILESTWEPESNLNCDKIAAYEERIRNAQNPQPEELRDRRRK